MRDDGSLSADSRLKPWPLDAPFGEELSAGRSNYGGNNIKQKFTQKERDEETGKDGVLIDKRDIVTSRKIE